MVSTVSGSGITTGTETLTGLQDLSGASAGQVKFPSTQNPSSDPHTLDDYSEGTFTPVFTTTGTGFTSGGNLSTGYYTKIGRVVYAFMNVSLSGAVSAGTGNVLITGLPFIVGTNTPGVAAIDFGHITLTGTLGSFCSGIGGTTTASIYFMASGTTETQMTAAQVNGNTSPYMSIMLIYFV